MALITCERGPVRRSPSQQDHHFVDHDLRLERLQLMEHRVHVYLQRSARIGRVRDQVREGVVFGSADLVSLAVGDRRNPEGELFGHGIEVLWLLRPEGIQATSQSHRIPDELEAVFSYVPLYRRGEALSDILTRVQLSVEAPQAGLPA